MSLAVGYFSKLFRKQVHIFACPNIYKFARRPAKVYGGSVGVQIRFIPCHVFIKYAATLCGSSAGPIGMS